jgi:hypothetical protein
MRFKTLSLLLLSGSILSGAPAAQAQMPKDQMASPAMTISASDLRVALNNLLAEHAQLGLAATGAAIRGQTAEFQAAAGALDANSVALSQAIGSVYGHGAEEAFLALWRKHIGFIVDYTTGVATKDQRKADKAVNDLLGYTKDFGAFLSAANPNLPTMVVADLVKGHVVGFKAAIDAQAKGDWATAFAKTREAVMHMQMIADPLAGAISKQFPERYASR